MQPAEPRSGWRSGFPQIDRCQRLIIGSLCIGLRCRPRFGAPIEQHSAARPALSEHKGKPVPSNLRFKIVTVTGSHVVNLRTRTQRNPSPATAVDTANRRRQAGDNDLNREAR